MDFDFKGKMEALRQRNLNRKRWPYNSNQLQVRFVKKPRPTTPVDESKGMDIAL